jgi:gliding motility-associated-like protein
MFCVCNASAQVNLSQGLVVHLPFNGNTNDVSGNNNHATNYGANLCPDRNGVANSAYYFDGIDDFMEILDNTTLHLTDSLTMVATIRLKHYYQGTCYNSRILTKGDDLSQGWYALNCSPGTLPISCNNSDTLQSVLRGDVGNTNANLTAFTNSIDIVNQNQWYCLCATFDGNQVKVYVDGQLVYAYQRSPIGVNNMNLFIGKHPFPNNEYWWNGEIDDVRIYSRAVNYEEVVALCGTCSQASPVVEILNNDTTLCSSTSIPLTTNISPEIDTFYWVSNGNLSNSGNSPTYTSTGFGVDTIKLVGIEEGCNLIENWNFEADTVGFYSAYTLMPNTSGANTAAQQYVVSTSNAPWNAFTNQCADHTTGFSRMLVVNGGTTANTIVWAQQTSVQPNTTYRFSYWAMNWSSAPFAVLAFSVNGVSIGTTATISTSTCQWQQYTYTWNSGANTTALLAIIDNTLTANGNDFAIDDIIFVPLDTVVDQVIVSTVASPTITTSGTAIICANQSTPISATGAVSYTWSPSGSVANSTAASTTASPNTTTTYTVTGANAAGCTATSTVQITVSNATPISLAGTPSICVGDTSTVTASGAVTYTWLPNNGSGGSNIGILSPSISTTYTIIGADANGCTTASTFSIDVLNYPELGATASRAIFCTNETSQLYVPNAQFYTWQPGYLLSDSTIQSPIANPSVTTIFTVIASNYTCAIVDSVQVQVNILNANTAYIPNAFTPNYDNVNDCFRIPNGGAFVEFNLRIYNRYGQLVYSSTDPLDCWDGTHNGWENTEMGSYYYILSGRTNCDKVESKGDITLIR